MKTSEKIRKLNEFLNADVKDPAGVVTHWNDFKIDGVAITIFTDDENIETSTGDLIPFLEKCTIIHDAKVIPPASNLPVKQSQETVLTSLPEGTIKSLGEILIDNINKVKDNPEYVKQASSINQSISTLIKLTNTELNITKRRNDE